MNLRLPFTLALAIALLTATSAQAQSTWAIVPVGLGESPSRAGDVADAASATLETSGATVLQGPVLAHRFENGISLSYEAPPGADELARRLAEADEPILRWVAAGRFAETVSRSEALLTEAQGALVALSRNAPVLEHLGNLCGYRLRAFLESRQQAPAQDAARECLRMLPGYEWTDRLHPPEVLALVRTTREALAGALVVHGSADDPPGCAIRVQGRRIGETPSARVAVPAGDYVVQLECSDAPGRVHRAHVEAAPVELEVRASLDQALHTRPSVALVYGSASALGALAGDVAAAGRAIEADRILAVVEQPSGVILRAFEIPDEGPARQLRETTLERGSDDARIRASIAQLANALASPNESPVGHSISPVGPVLLGIGGAALVAGAITGILTLIQDSSLSSLCPDQECSEAGLSFAREVEAFAVASDILLLGGATTAVVGLVFTLLLHESNSASSPPHVSASCGATGCRVVLGGSF
jgi:hypothetical protein